jgi:hypothetical protein
VIFEASSWDTTKGNSEDVAVATDKHRTALHSLPLAIFKGYDLETKLSCVTTLKQSFQGLQP